MRFASACVLTVLLPAVGSAQATLSDAAARAKSAWFAHDPVSLVGSSSNLILQIPGADLSSPVDRPQAIELLRRYFRPVEERGLDVTAIREVEPGKGFVELARRYVVTGTAELRHETLFLGYRLAGREWRLVELRSTP